MTATLPSWQERHDRLVARLAHERAEFAGVLRHPLASGQELHRTARRLAGRLLPFALLPLALLLVLRPRRAVPWLVGGFRFVRFAMQLRRGLW